MQLRPRLNGFVSPAAAVDEEDARETKTALAGIGRYRPPAWGMSGVPDPAMFDGLAAFQRDAGLRPDREMRPAGPTHALLHAELDRRRPGRPARPLTIGRAVGENADNRPEDVRPLRAGLAALRYLPEGEARRPRADFDASAASALGAFQLDFNLRHDRLARPEGPTVRMLGRASAPHRRAAAAEAAALPPPPAAAPKPAGPDAATAPGPRAALLRAAPPRDPFERDRVRHLERLGDLLDRGLPLNEPDALLGVTVLEALGEDRAPGLTPVTAAKLFRLAQAAERDDAVREVWDAVADPSFPVRRGRFRLAGGETVELSQAEANGDADDVQVAMRRRRPLWEPQGSEGYLPLFPGGGGARGRRAIQPTLNSPSDTPEDEEADETAGEASGVPVPRRRQEQTPTPASPPPDDPNQRDIQFRVTRDVTTQGTRKSIDHAGQTIRQAYDQIRNNDDRDFIAERLEESVVESDRRNKANLVNFYSDKTPAEAKQKFMELGETKAARPVYHPDADVYVIDGKDGVVYTYYERTSNKKKRNSGND